MADITKQIHENAGWELIKIVKMSGCGRPNKSKKKVNQKKKHFVFKKYRKTYYFCFYINVKYFYLTL